jgi:hypothetical protein
MKRRIISLFLFLLCTGAVAQEVSPGQPNELDRNYVPDKNSVFNSDGKRNEDAGPVEIKNAILFNPTLLSRSIVALFYERWLGSQTSLKAGGGICFNQDFIYSTAFDAGIESSGILSDPISTVSLATIMSRGQFVGPSLYGSFSVKRSWDGYATEWNPYLELNCQASNGAFKISTYEDSYYDYDNFNNYSGPLIAGNPLVNVRTVSFNLMYGSRYITAGRVKTSHEFFLGIGAKLGTYDSFHSEEIKVEDPSYPGHYQNVQVEMKGSIRENVWSPSFLMGYIFGIGF